MKPIVIAIDGPSGAGKGTVSRTVSHVLGFRHIDTGAMYRAVGWKALRDAIALDDEPSVAALAQRAELVVEGGFVTIDGHDVTHDIRTPEMDKTAAAGARGAGGAAARAGRGRWRGDGGARHRDGGVPERAAQDLPRRLDRRARAPARQ